MKKIISFALVAVMLCVAFAAFAEGVSVPSKTTDDMTSFDVTVENPVDGKAVSLLPINESTVDDITKYQANLDNADAELKKLQEAASLDAYFGDAAKEIAAILGDGEISVDEFLAVIEIGYEDGMGNATIKAKFATPYEKDEKVAVLIGIPGDAIAWKTFEGVGQDDGSVQFTVDADTMKAIEANTAILAACSK